MATKVMVSFPSEFLAEVDRIAQEEHRSRSELLREAMRPYREMRGGEKRSGDLSRVRPAVMAQDALCRLAPGTGEDSAADVRGWREAQQGASKTLDEADQRIAREIFRRQTHDYGEIVPITQ